MISWFVKSHILSVAWMCWNIPVPVTKMTVLSVVCMDHFIFCVGLLHEVCVMRCNTPYLRIKALSNNRNINCPRIHSISPPPLLISLNCSWLIKTYKFKITETFKHFICEKQLFSTNAMFKKHYCDVNILFMTRYSILPVSCGWQDWRFVVVTCHLSHHVTSVSGSQDTAVSQK